MSLNEQISEEAAQWLVEFRSGEIDLAERRDFDSWLRASPEHVRAFIDMAAIWHEGAAIDPRRRIDVEEIIARAQSEPSVTNLHTTVEGVTVSCARPDPAAPDTLTSRDRATVRQRKTRVSARTMAAGLLTAVAAAVLILDAGLFGPRTYSTGVRVRRSITLADGSTVLLDSKSRLRISFTSSARAVQLLQGQALFHVRHDPRRPFLVRAGNTAVMDVGTVFDLNRMGNGAIVTVVQGRVAVAVARALHPGNTTRDDRLNAPGGTQPIYLSAGEQLDAWTGHPSLKPVHVDVRSETAWTHGNVVLESATLTQIARIFNRYSTRRLVAKDLGGTPLRLSGVFSTDPSFMIGYLRSRPDIAITETHSEVTIVRAPHP